MNAIPLEPFYVGQLLVQEGIARLSEGEPMTAVDEWPVEGRVLSRGRRGLRWTRKSLPHRTYLADSDIRRRMEG